MGRNDRPETDQTVLVSTRELFSELVTEALESRKLKTFPLAKGYLVELLEFYVPAANLFDEVDSSGRRTRETLAELFLRAQTSENSVKLELLKKLADRSLYISGFFGDSLQRKLVDVDYYIDMGGTAYSVLSDSVREDGLARMYREFSNRFLEFVEVLTHISSRASMQSEENIMRLYEVYAKTGSDYARDKLMEKGLIAVPMTSGQVKKQ